MRLRAVTTGGNPRPQLCLEVDGKLRAVGEHSCVAELLSAEPAADSLEEAVQAAGVGAAIPDGGRDVSAAVPVRPAEVWAAGVTYERSRDARIAESQRHADAYQLIYDADRPELFLKATGPRVVGPDAAVGLRSDSAWQVPEPELGLVLNARGAIVGYTLGNDMSSRDIEGENTLYLPQAKIFAGSCALGPAVCSTAAIEDPYGLELRLRILRGPQTVVHASVSTARLHKRLDTLVTYLCRDNWIAPGTVLLTGTGIVPDDDVTLHDGDIAEIRCEPIGTLRNHCVPAATLAPPAQWRTESAASRVSQEPAR